MQILHKNVGVVSFLGTYLEHQNILEKLGVMWTPVYTIADLESVDALIVPGGEWPTLKFALEPLLNKIAERTEEGMPLCLEGKSLLLLDEKQNTPLSIKKMQISDYRREYPSEIKDEIILSFADTKAYLAHWIHPVNIQKITKKWQVLANYQGSPILIENQNIIAHNFYSAFSKDYRLHEYFISKI